MAINGPKGQSAQQQQQGNQQQQQTQQTEFAQQQTQWNQVGDMGQQSIVDFLTGGASPLSPQADSELLSKLADALRLKMVKDGKPLTGFKIESIDQNVAKTRVSALVVTYSSADAAGRENVCALTMILEASAHRAGFRTSTWNQQTYELAITAGDVWDDEFWHKIQTRVANQYEELPVIHDVGCVVIPAGFDIEDGAAVHRLAYNATMACAMRASELSGAPLRPMNLPVALKGGNYYLSSSNDFSARKVTNAIGRTVRSDVVVTTSLNQQVQAGQQNSVNYRDSANILSELGGYVDINFAGQTAAPSNGFNQAPMGSQVYLAEFVITNINTSFFDVTLEKLMFAIGSVASMDRDSSWAHSFLPRSATAGKRTPNLRDVSVLGLDYDPTGKGVYSRFVGKGGAPMSTEELGSMLTTLFYRNMIVSLDVDPTGIHGWLLNDFVRAAAGDDAAALRILNACNQLTGGAFAQCWKGTTKDVVTFRRSINLGEWVDQDGETRDLRDIDYIGFQNLTEDRLAWKAWAATLDNPNLPDAIALAEQQKLLKNLLPSATFQSVGYRLTLQPALLLALASAMDMAKISIRPDCATSNAWGTTQQRGNQSLLQQAVSGIGNTIYSYQQPGATGNPFGGVGAGRISGFGR